MEHKTSSDKLMKAKEELEVQVAELQRQLEQASCVKDEVEVSQLQQTIQVLQDERAAEAVQSKQAVERLEDQLRDAQAAEQLVRTETERETTRLQAREEELEERVSELQEKLKPHLFGPESKTMEAQFNRLQQEVADRLTEVAPWSEKGEDSSLVQLREQWRTEVDGLKEERTGLKVELASAKGKMEGMTTLIEQLQTGRVRMRRM